MSKYDHSDCSSEAHDREAPAEPHEQALDGELACNDCGQALMICDTYDDYDHAEPTAEPCFLVNGPHAREGNR